MPSRPLRTALTAATVALLALPAGAAASASMEIGIADENVLKGQIGDTDAVIRQWKASGVQDVRVFARWYDMVPDRDRPVRPVGFDAENPASYDLGELDRKIDAVVRGGLNVTLVVTGPGPVWGSSEPARLKPAWRPDPKQFGRFAKAIATHVGARVDRYIVWNEPNQGSWLQPQYACVGTTTVLGARCTSVAPHLYRELARSGFSAIHAADPKARVAIGATSSRGDEFPRRTLATTQPLRFLRTMSCVDDRYDAVRSGRCKGFKPVTGDALAYHPHSLSYSPGRRDRVRDNARMADLGRLTTVADKLTTRKRLKVRGAKRLPLWLDEYGYETNPPDKDNGQAISPRKAALWLQWGWSIAARNPRVEMLTQYEWFDESTGTDGEEFNRWQSGLYTVDGKPKPLAEVFAHPIHGWRTPKRGYVWGQVRPGNGVTTVRLQRRSGKAYRTVKTVKTTRSGVFQVRVPASSAARYRFTYVDPATNAEVVSAVTTLRRA